MARSDYSADPVNPSSEVTVTDALVDRYGRVVRTLRLSLTPECNFRCVYCLPPEGVAQDAPSAPLSLDQTVRLVRVIARLGVSRVRLTGGEPLLRDDIVDVVAALRTISGIEEISMTTNASRLARLARPLARAGLDRVNVSLDSLDAARFARITGYRRIDRVRDGIVSARRAGLPVKINVVAIRGMSDDEIVEFVRMAADDACEVRFLEFMPLCGSGWSREQVFPIGEIRNVVRRHFRLDEVERGDAPAQSFLVDGGPGRVGFIAPLTEPFCDACSRMRLSADGRIQPCLFANDQTDVGALVRAGADDDAIAARLREAIRRKSRGSQYDAKPFDPTQVAGDDDTSGPLIRVIGG